MKRATLIMAFLFLIMAFQESPPLPLSPLAQRALEVRLQEYREEQWALCQKRAIDRAAHEVDSLIIIWAKANRDTLNRPLIPPKPEVPERLIPKDSVPVAPLFPAEDSLQ
jgi:hypothetical protein